MHLDVHDFHLDGPPHILWTTPQMIDPSERALSEDELASRAILNLTAPRPW